MWTSYRSKLYVNLITYYYGITENCILYKVHGVHLTKNIAVDPMHDILEGTCRYNIATILNYFSFVKKYFTLKILNFRILGFNYGLSSNVNRPPESEENNIKNGFIEMSSSDVVFSKIFKFDYWTFNTEPWWWFLAIISSYKRINDHYYKWPTLYFNL